MKGWLEKGRKRESGVASCLPIPFPPRPLPPLRRERERAPADGGGGEDGGGGTEELVSRVGWGYSLASSV